MHKSWRLLYGYLGRDFAFSILLLLKKRVTWLGWLLEGLGAIRETGEPGAWVVALKRVELIL